MGNRGGECEKSGLQLSLGEMLQKKAFAGGRGSLVPMQALSSNPPAFLMREPGNEAISRRLDGES